ncbi:acetylserotonin O-methyltransferase-like [Nicotiana tabacum]|uniref:3'-hydroxy-N-methyl-(S)-coclaurine 4'-O-methyltransferase 2-like n=1 Tax=Nicotiana tabacum TaxID=4097 RepID=A0A1S4CK11_TOBAC|nr:PREDICTED: 3'-hydroxy-N-methyl-(S)-coclaurine 4'-O-methyltransferase 2-like [Nicotiana tabacum]
MGEETNGSVARIHEGDKAESQAQEDIWKYTFGFTEMAAVKCAIELGIPDFLENHQKPITLNQLSSALGCSSSNFLYRILRFLINRGIFKEESTGHGEIGYVQTPLSRLLRRDGGNSMAALVLLEASPVMLAPWHFLNARVLAKGNTAAFSAVHGKDVWEYAETNPEHSKLINDAMACHARVAIRAIIDNCPEIFKGIETLVDVGGGDGTTISLLVKTFPWIRGINFDLPHVVSVALPCHGVRHVEGNMFDSIPKADAAFLMSVLHDWSDEKCIQILKNCIKIIPKDTGKVIIVEVVLEKERGGNEKLKDVGFMLDMVMMAHTTNGKERTAKEWAHILTAAGFNRHCIKHINAIASVILAYP